jgi:hypothetical protein
MIREFIQRQWNPQPINPPTPDPEIEKLTGIQRSAEVVRYSILSVEYWISPNGRVREWVRNNTLVAVVLAVPAFLVLPIVTFALWQFVSWLMALTSIAGKLIILPVLLIVAVASIAAAMVLLKVVFRK